MCDKIRMKKPCTSAGVCWSVCGRTVYWTGRCAEVEGRHAVRGIVLGGSSSRASVERVWLSQKKKILVLTSWQRTHDAHLTPLNIREGLSPVEL